jgi:hypothetical protein
MSRYAAELERRIASGESIEVTREWFLKCMSTKPDLYYRDLSLQEQKFFEHMMSAFTAWLEQRRPPLDESKELPF